MDRPTPAGLDNVLRDYFALHPPSNASPPDVDGFIGFLQTHPLGRSIPVAVHAALGLPRPSSATHALEAGRIVATEIQDRFFIAWSERLTGDGGPPNAETGATVRDIGTRLRTLLTTPLLRPLTRFERDLAKRWRAHAQALPGGRAAWPREHAERFIGHLISEERQELLAALDIAERQGPAPPVYLGFDQETNRLRFAVFEADE